MMYRQSMYDWRLSIIHPFTTGICLTSKNILDFLRAGAVVRKIVTKSVRPDAQK